MQVNDFILINFARFKCVLRVLPLGVPLGDSPTGQVFLVQRILGTSQAQLQRVEYNNIEEDFIFIACGFDELSFWCDVKALYHCQS